MAQDAHSGCSILIEADLYIRGAIIKDQSPIFKSNMPSLSSQERTVTKIVSPSTVQDLAVHSP